MTHEVFTIVAPIRDRAASTHLKQILAEINANPSGNALLPFGKLPMVHFASFVVFSDPVQEAKAPPLLDHLVFENCIDGPFEAYIEALLHLGLQTLHELFSCCLGYDNRVASNDGVRAYIVAKRRKPHLLHIGSPGLRVDHINAGDSLRRVLDRELDDVVKRGRSTDRPLDLMRSLRASLNLPPSTRDHWFLRKPTLTETEQRRFAWFADQQSHLGSQLRHWGKLIVLALTLFAVVWWSGSWLWNHGGARSIFFALVGLVAVQLLFWRWLTRGKPWEGQTARQKAEVKQNQGARRPGPSGSEQDGQPRHPQIGMDDVDRDESRPLVFQSALSNIVYRSSHRDGWRACTPSTSDTGRFSTSRRMAARTRSRRP